MKRRFPFFEITVIVTFVLIGLAVDLLYRVGPVVKETWNDLAELRDTYFAISHSVLTNMAYMEASLTNASNRKAETEGLYLRDVCRAWTTWLEAELYRWPTATSNVSAGLPAGHDVDAANQLKLARRLLSPFVEKILNAQTNYLKAETYLVLNRGKPLIKDQLAVQDLAAQGARACLNNLARQARMHGEALGLVLVRSQAQFGTLEQRLRSKWAGLLLAVAGSCFLLVTLIYRRTVAGSLAIAEERTQQELEQRSRLDKLAHFGRLAQEVVHEIKQPLTAMNARAFTLQKGVSPDSDAFRDAVVIRSEVKRLDRIVKDFLLLAKPTEPRLADLRAADALTEVRNLMAPHLAHDSIEFKFDCDDRLRFRADLAQIKQVLINLIKNAAECLAPRGGSVTLRAKAATEDRAGKATEVAVIEVEDTGPGIPIELQEKIFEPFFSTKGDGTGLGLAIATRIVDKHGGRLELDTEPGRGTVFRIILPACSNHQTS